MSFILDVLRDPVAASSDGMLMVSTISAAAVGWFCVFHPMLLTQTGIVKRAKWWPIAKSAQRKLMINFGYPEDGVHDPVFPNGIEDETVAQSFYWTSFAAAHHTIGGLMTLPLALMGWEAAGPLGHKLFLWGIIWHTSWDLFDFVYCSFRALMPDKVFAGAIPMKYYIIGPVMHHLTSILTAVPLSMYFLQNSDFHRITCALLLAAGICYSTGQYKYTLDISKPSSLQMYKIIATIQFVTTIFTRVVVYAWSGSSLISTVHSNFQPALAGSYFGLISMGLFNLLVVLDATDQFHKWVISPEAGLKALGVDKKD